MRRYGFLTIILLSFKYDVEAFIFESVQKSRSREVIRNAANSYREGTKLNIASNNNRHLIDFRAGIQKKVYTYFSNSPDINLMSFSLANHKPMGCSAEECLKVEDDGLKHVFISTLVEQGNAEKAGILVGDVLVGVSGSFMDIEDVFGIGLNRIKSLIGGRPPEQNLELIIVRGTDIQSKHDTALVDLCILPEDNDVIMRNCIKALFDSSRDSLDNDADESSEVCDDKDTECMLDAMFRHWDEGEGIQEKL